MLICQLQKIPRWRQALLTGLAVLSAVFALAACAPSSDSSGTTAAAPASTYFPIAIGDQTLELQLALTESEQQQGLMFREALGENQGMLFLFDQPDRRSFWMRNTPLPLDIGYFDEEGRLLEVYALFPFDESPVRSVSREVLIAVETNQGWFRENGVQRGARIDMTALAEATKARGMARMPGMD